MADNHFTMPLVTILTVAYNSEKTIAKTIDSVLEQTYQNIEYIIIDGNSEDKTVSIARSYQNKFDSVHGRLLIIISEPDSGMYDALNKGACMAHGELVGQINADDWYEKDAVQTMVNLYQEKQYDVAWGNMRIKSPKGDVIKNAKIGFFWTTNGWCHPAMFSRLDTLKRFPYACESMYDDFDYITAVRRANQKIVTTNHLISNFSFGGMSTKKEIKEVLHRIKIRYHIYSKYNYSSAYFLYCIFIEITKYMIS